MPLRYLDKCLRWALVVLFLTMTGVSFLQVVARYGFNNALPWPDELSRYAFVYAVFLGAAVAMRDRTHFRVDLVPGLLPKRARLLVEAVGYCMAIPCLVLFALHSLPLLDKGWTQMSATLGVPVAYVYLALPLGALLMALNAARTIGNLVAMASRSSVDSPSSEVTTEPSTVAVAEEASSGATGAIEPTFEGGVR